MPEENVPIFCGQPVDLKNRGRMEDLLDRLLVAGRLSQEESEILDGALKDRVADAIERCY